MPTPEASPSVMATHATQAHAPGHVLAGATSPFEGMGGHTGVGSVFGTGAKGAGGAGGSLFGGPSSGAGPVGPASQGFFKPPTADDWAALTQAVVCLPQLATDVRECLAGLTRLESAVAALQQEVREGAVPSAGFATGPRAPTVMDFGSLFLPMQVQMGPETPAAFWPSACQEGDAAQGCRSHAVIEQVDDDDDDDSDCGNDLGAEDFLMAHPLPVMCGEATAGGAPDAARVEEVPDAATVEEVPDAARVQEVQPAQPAPPQPAPSDMPETLDTHAAPAHVDPVASLSSMSLRDLTRCSTKQLQAYMAKVGLTYQPPKDSAAATLFAFLQQK